MSDIMTIEKQEFANKYADLAATAGIEAAEEYAVSVLGDKPTDEVLEEYRPFVNEAMESRKEEIISTVIKGMVGQETEDGDVDGSTGDDSTGDTEQLAIVESSQEAHSEEQSEDSTQA